MVPNLPDLYQQKIKETRELVKEADTIQIRQEVYDRIAEILGMSVGLERIATDLDLQMKRTKRGVLHVVLQDQLEGLFPPLLEEEFELPSGVEIRQLPSVVVPTAPEEGPRRGNGGFEKPKIIPRTRLAIDVLREMGIDLTQCEFFEGINTPGMMRRLSYRIIMVDPIKRVILVCDEENNKTFVLYKMDTPENIAGMRKDDLEELVGRCEAAGLTWNEPRRWKKRLRELLEQSSGQPKPTRGTKEDAEQPPTGWVTDNAVAEQLKVHPSITRRLADGYRKTHPGWFREFKQVVSPWHIIEHHSPELASAIAGEVEKTRDLGNPPDGWMTSRASAKELGTTQSTIKRITDGHREAHPEWFREFCYPGTIMLREYFAPELINIVRTGIERKKQAGILPDGWIGNTVLAAELKIRGETIRSMASKYREAHPEWFGEFYPPETKGRTYECYSPELTKVIREEIEKIRALGQLPEGWMTNAALAKELTIAPQTVERLANKYCEAHPEWTREFCNPQRLLVRRYYSPELARAVSEELKRTQEEIGTPPEGWMTRNELTQEIKTDNTTINRLAEAHRSDKPEWFRRFAHPTYTGQVYEYFSPELVSVVKEAYETSRRFGPPPEGWLTNLGLCQKLGDLRISRETMRRIAERYRDGHPEWFGTFNHPTVKRTFEYYSPELCAEIERQARESRNSS